MQRQTIEPAAGDARDTVWHRFIVEIDDLLATGQFTWAEPTLRGIQETVGQQGRVTGAQRQAVAHIEARPSDAVGRRW